MGIDLSELESYLKATPPGSGKGAIVSLSFGEVNTVRVLKGGGGVLHDLFIFLKGDFTPDVCEIRALCDRYGVWLHIDAGVCKKDLHPHPDNDPAV